MEELLRDRRLLYVTGKGGVGKTTVAASLGLAAAAAGRCTIVCEVAEQDRVSRAFRREGVQRETEVQLADNLWAISIDPRRALEEWLRRPPCGGGGPRLNSRAAGVPELRRRVRKGARWGKGESSGGAGSFKKKK